MKILNRKSVNKEDSIILYNHTFKFIITYHKYISTTGNWGDIYMIFKKNFFCVPHNVIIRPIYNTSMCALPLPFSLIIASYYMYLN